MTSESDFKGWTGSFKNYIGIDFSGAASAGKTIWLATGVEKGRFLKILDCRRAENLPGSGPDRAICLQALKVHLARQGEALIGLDFPFGLPQTLVKAKDWESFVLDFPFLYSSPERFRQSCYELAGGKEYKRDADKACRAPFSPYNLRLYKQTYYGIRDILYPLVKSKQAFVWPMQPAVKARPGLIEICPASTLKKQNLYYSYKGRGDEKLKQRIEIMHYLEAAKNLVFASGEIREAALNDPGGDAVDSLIALAATTEAEPGRPAGDTWKVEGYTYF